MFFLFKEIKNKKEKKIKIFENQIEIIDTSPIALENKSKIDNIEFDNSTNITEESINLIKKSLPYKNNKTDQIKENQLSNIEPEAPENISKNIEEENTINITKEKNIEELSLEPIDENQNTEEILEAEEIDENDINYLIEAIEVDNIKYPGKIDIFKIDPFLLDKVIETEAEHKQEETFGVNRVQVFYNIDKQLYRSRSTKKYNKERLNVTKKGLFLPAMILTTSIITLVIALLLFNIYQKFSSNVSLEDNIFKDDSIMTKLAQKLNEEKSEASKKLEEERKRLEEERKNRESIIKDELEKRQSEIESRFQKKMEELRLQKNLSEEEISRLAKQYEESKNRELEIARRDAKLQEERVTTLLKQKEAEIEEAKIKLQKEKENIALEIEKLKNESERRKIDEENFIKQSNQRLEEIRKRDEEINNFNINISQILNTGLVNIRQQKYDEAVEILNSAIKYYEARSDFVKQTPVLSRRMDTDLAFIQNIKNLIELSKINPNKEYDFLIKKFTNITQMYQRAENFYNEKNFDKAGKEYENILNEIKEINNSYQKLKEIEKQNQNRIAKNLFDQGIKENNKEKAIQIFSTIIKTTPLSDYTERAINEIINLSESEYSGTNILTQLKKEQDQKAEVIFNKAKSLTLANRLDEALNNYYEIITEYPYSKYIKDAAEEIKKINQTLALKKEKDTPLTTKQKDEELKTLFEKELIKFKEALKKGETENARKYYLEALQLAFNNYLDNSIKDFIALDDSYIKEQLKLKEQQLLSSEKEKVKIIKELQNQITEKNKTIDDYQRKINELSLNQPISKEKIALIEKYENQIKEQNLTIEKLRQYISETEKSSNAIERENLLKDYENKLKLEKDKLENLKRQLYESYKTNNELLVKIQQIEEIKNQYSDLLKKYNELEKKYNEKSISKEEKSIIEKEIISKLEKELKTKYELEKEKEIQQEKARLQENFAKELKDYISQIKNFSLNADKNITDESLLFGRVTDIAGDSIVFQLLSLSKDISLNLKEGDIVEVVRVTFIDGKKNEIRIGYVKIRAINENSIYGRAEKISDIKGYTIQKGDLLKR